MRDRIFYSICFGFIFGVLLIVLAIVSFFIDLIFSGFYPILVNHALKGKISFRKAFSEFKPKLFPLVISGILVCIFSLVITIIEAGIILKFNFSELSLLLSFIVSFALIFFFYFLYPVIVFKNKGIVSNFKENFLVSLSNKKTIFFYSLIPFSVSIIKFAVGLFANDQNMLILFWLLVILTTIVYTLHVVVNQLLFLKTQKKK